MNKQEFMAMSLPYDIKCKFITERIQHYSATKYEAEFDTKIEVIKSIPILRPLSDFIGCDMNSFEFKVVHQISCFYDNGDYLRLYDKEIDIDSLPFYVIKILIANHFDIAGLIEKGEAVDYHTIPDFVF